MRLFGAYIRQHRRSILMLILFGVIFCVTFMLYQLPVEAVLYPVLLCGFFGVIFIMIDFSRIKRNHDKLKIVEKLTAAMIDSLPEAESVENQDYQKIIKTLCEEAIQLETLETARYQDMVEYYTMWVHQIKTPIASMRLTLQNEDTPLSRKLSLDLFHIEQYVEMVLTFLRLDSTSTDYVFRNFNLDGLVKQAVSKFAPEFIDRKIQLLYELPEHTIVTDDKWFLFVIEQILSNALKYTEQGSIKVYMKEPQLLCIEDTGIGIAADDLPRIFEKGYTGYNGRMDKRASGIGLYLCKRVCGNLGIRLSVSSEVGKGTAVCLDLEQYELKKE